MLLITIHHLQECACTCFQMLIHLNHNRYFHQQGILLHIKSISEIQGLPMFVIRTITKKVLVKQITCNFSLVTVVLETSGKFYYTLAGWKFLGFILQNLLSSFLQYALLYQVAFSQCLPVDCEYDHHSLPTSCSTWGQLL